ncbi:MAG TPA: LptA/OstA family protein [Allosphingosinicella sp.]|nr:LptA/OstA family protein [Allosphingosinicella sp.]
MKRYVPFLLLILLGPAAAVGQVSALKGHKTNAPVDVAADRIEVQDRADRAIFSGNVVVRQGDLTLTAPRLTVAYSSGGGVELRRIDATGGVTVKSPSETARGNIGIYDTRARIITLIGDVSLVQRDANVNGGRLVIDLDSGRAVMDGGGPPGTTRQGGRVTGRFTVPQKSGS